MSRRDIWHRESDSDCAVTPLMEGGWPTVKRSWVPRWVRSTVATVKWLVLFFLAMLAAGTAASIVFVQPCDAQIHADSSAAIVLVHNYLDIPVAIYVRMDSLPYPVRPLGIALPLSQTNNTPALFVIPSVQLRLAKELHVVAMPPRLHPTAESDPIPRRPGVVNVIQVPVGTPPEPLRQSE